MRALTARQQSILDYVLRYGERCGYPPTLREIGEAVGVANVSAVRGHLAALEKKGRIVRDPDKARSIRVVGEPSLLSRVRRRFHEVARTDAGVLHTVVYGLGFLTRGRRPVLVGRAKDYLAAAIEKRAVEHGWTLLDARIEPDHVALVVRVWPNHSPAQVVSRVRMTAAALRRRYSGLFEGRTLLARGHVVTTDPDQLDVMIDRLLSETPIEAPV